MVCLFDLTQQLKPSSQVADLLLTDTIGQQDDGKTSSSASSSGFKIQNRQKTALKTVVA